MFLRQMRNPRQEGPDLNSHPESHGLWGCDPLGPKGPPPPTKWRQERRTVLEAGQVAGQEVNGVPWARLARWPRDTEEQGGSGPLRLTGRALGVEKKPPDECVGPCWTLA